MRLKNWICDQIKEIQTVFSVFSVKMWLSGTSMRELHVTSGFANQQGLVPTDHYLMNSDICQCYIIPTAFTQTLVHNIGVLSKRQELSQ